VPSGACIVQDIGYYPFGNNSASCCTTFAAETSLWPCCRTQTTSAEKKSGNQYQKANWRTRFFAPFVRILPKIGSLKNVDNTPTSTTTEDLYIKSVNKTLDSYRAQLTTFVN